MWNIVLWCLAGCLGVLGLWKVCEIVAWAYCLIILCLGADNYGAWYKDDRDEHGD